jgi:hypothetical protein
MPTCGYICPQCGGKGFLDETLEDCTWCNTDEKTIISDEDWLRSVHEGNCCADATENEQK